MRVKKVEPMEMQAQGDTTEGDSEWIKMDPEVPDGFKTLTPVSVDHAPSVSGQSTSTSNLMRPDEAAYYISIDEVHELGSDQKHMSFRSPHWSTDDDSEAGGDRKMTVRPERMQYEPVKVVNQMDCVAMKQTEVMRMEMVREREVDEEIERLASPELSAKGGFLPEPFRPPETPKDSVPQEPVEKQSYDAFWAHDPDEMVEPQPEVPDESEPRETSPKSSSPRNLTLSTGSMTFGHSHIEQGFGGAAEDSEDFSEEDPLAHISSVIEDKSVNIGDMLDDERGLHRPLIPLPPPLPVVSSQTTAMDEPTAPPQPKVATNFSVDIEKCAKEMRKTELGKTTHKETQRVLKEVEIRDMLDEDLSFSTSPETPRGLVQDSIDEFEPMPFPIHNYSGYPLRAGAGPPPPRAPAAPAPPPCPAPVVNSTDDGLPSPLIPLIPLPPPLPVVSSQPMDGPTAPPQPKVAKNFSADIEKCAKEMQKTELGKTTHDPEVRITDPDILAKETQRILKEVEKSLKAMHELYVAAESTGDEQTVYMSPKFRNRILTLRNIYFSFTKQPIKEREALRIQIAELFCKDDHFLEYLRGTIEFAYEHGYDDDGQLLSSHTRSIVNPLTILYNFTDAADNFTICVCKTPGLTPLLVKIAEEQFEKVNDGNCDKFNRQVIRACVAVIYNCATREQNRKSLRRVGAVKMFIPYLDCNDEKFQLNALFGLAFLCDEDESEIFQARSELIKFFLKKLEHAVTDENKKSGGWSLYEMTRACSRLAINDINKQLLGEAGAIDILVDIASLNDGDQEQIDATAALWTLSFEATNKERIRENDKAIELLKSLAEKEDNKPMARAAKGCLWTVGCGKKTKRSSVDEYREPEQTGKQQIMISYQWDYQELILKVRDHLREKGYKIWIDVEQMGGSTLEAMAKAVEHSSIVLVAMSQTYKDSSNTRAEAEYAFTQGKRIIPLRVEHNYKPDGWLGIIVGSKLYFDICQPDLFQQKMNELYRELESISTKEAPMVSQIAETATAAPPSRALPPPVSSFDEQHVQTWLSETKFKSAHLQNLRPDHLRCLQVMKRQAPKYYYNFVERLVTKRISLDELDDLVTISNKLDGLT